MIAITRQQVHIARDHFGDPELTREDVERRITVRIGNTTRERYTARLGLLEAPGLTPAEAVDTLFRRMVE